MTPADFKAIRKLYNMTQPQFAQALGLEGAHADRTIRKYESGAIPIMGPVKRCAELLAMRKPK